MKKVLCFAAAALTLFAACQKTTVVYDNSEPQEIAVFAVNKTATKAPVADATFPTDYKMQVAAYLASGGIGTESGDYFDGTLFSKGDGTVWTGGKYWPMSAATLNFLAVAVPRASSSYTGTAEVVFGETTGEGEEATKSNFVKKAVVTFANNQTVEAVAEGTDESDAPTPAVEANYNQFDLMYAAGSQSHTEGGTYNNVEMPFKHALSWIKFTVATNLKNKDANDDTFSMTVKSIRLSGASYGGTLTISTTAVLTGNLANATYSPVWTSWSTAVDDVYVPNADGNAKADAVSGLSTYEATPTAKPFGNGLLVVPCDYTKTNTTTPSVTINYTMDQGDGEYTFERTVTIPAINWECNKIYTYALNINLTEISINPSVSSWTDYDNDGNTAGIQPIEVNTNTNTPAN